MLRDPAKPVPTRSHGRRRADLVYQRFLPHQYLRLLGKRGVEDLRLGDSAERNATILFADIRGFTSLLESLPPREAFRFVNSYMRAMEPALTGAHGFVDKYIGDEIMAVFPTSADDALRGAIGMLERLRSFNAGRRRALKPPVRVGIGLNTGLVTAGALGSSSRISTTVISDAVNLASRLQTLTKTYGVSLLISEHTFYSLTCGAEHDIRFVDRVRVRGKEQPQSVYEVFDADPPGLRAAKRATRELFEEALAHYHLRDGATACRLLRRCLARFPGDQVARVYLDRCARFKATGVHEGTGETDVRVSFGPQYLVGHSLIDEQHRALFGWVNRFARVVHTARSGEQLQRASAFLRRYVEEHFADEERVMREEHYPHLDVQRQQHERFARDFAILDAELRRDLGTRRVFLLFKVQLLVVDWLANHTMKADRHFGRWLAGRRRVRKTGGRR